MTFPAQSVTDHVLVSTSSPGHAPAALCVKVTTRSSPQLSVAVIPGSPGTSAKHITVISAGVALSTGGILSSIVTIWTCVVTLPTQSSTVQVLVIVSSPGQAPGVD